MNRDRQRRGGFNISDQPGSPKEGASAECLMRRLQEKCSSGIANEGAGSRKVMNRDRQRMGHVEEMRQPGSKCGGGGGEK